MTPGIRRSRREVVDRVDANAATDDATKHGRRPPQWKEIAKPESSVIVDGGTVSNFPVWIFDAAPADGAPQRMTFGFTLTGGKGIGPNIGFGAHLVPWPAHFAVELFQTAQSAWDTRFASHSTRLRTITVDAGDIATTQFTLTEAEKDFLVKSGRTAVDDYLAHFDPSDYVNTYGARLASR